MAGSSRFHITAVALVLAGAAALAFQAPPPASAERVAFDAWVDGQAQQALEARRARMAALKTRENIEARQRDVRAGISEMLGVLPAWDGPLERDDHANDAARRLPYRAPGVPEPSWIQGHRAGLCARGAGPVPGGARDRRARQRGQGLSDVSERVGVAGAAWVRRPRLRPVRAGRTHRVPRPGEGRLPRRHRDA